MIGLKHSVKFFLAAFAAIALIGAATANAQSPFTAPLLDRLVHTGVASCSSAGCHGDQVVGRGAGPVVGQNEYFKWRAPGAQGAHSRAFATLRTAHSQRIANNLGLGAAHEASECLACHSDNVAPQFRGDRFLPSDGVGCEACHGGAENWLALHRIGPGHQANIDAGLYPTPNAEARASLCLNCHLGSSAEDQFVSHRLMGAGHPRLKFELDLYTAMQAHHIVDADYVARKETPSGARVWAIGQAYALTRTLTLLASNETGQQGAFPELVFFDCHACHQPITSGDDDLSWRPNPGRNLGPGAPTINDANLIMLTAAMRVLDPEIAARLDMGAKALHAASLSGREALKAAALALRVTSNEAASALAAADLEDPNAARDILMELVDNSLSARYTNYAVAEQALFAAQRLAAHLNLEDSAVSDAISAASMHAQSPYTYNQDAFRRAFADLDAALRQWRQSDG